MTVRNLRAVFCSLGGVGCFLLAGFAAAASSEEGLDATGAITVDEGRVIIDGRYIPRPYRITHEDGNVYINGQLFFSSPDSAERSAARQERRSEDVVAEDGPAPDNVAVRHTRPRSAGGRRDEPSPSRSSRSRRTNPVGWLSRQLCGDTLLIRWPDGAVRQVIDPESLDLLDVLISEQQQSEKLEAISVVVRNPADPHWAELIASFVLTEEAAEELLPVIEARRKVRRENEEKHRRLVEGYALFSDSVLYSINVLGMLLVVVSFGTVLSYRPRQRVPWRRVDRSGRGCRMVLQNVSLIVLLSAFDLGCTLLANAHVPGIESP